MNILIALCKPIPANGRKPTIRECMEFKQKLELSVTLSGAWTLGWSDANGKKTPQIKFTQDKQDRGVTYYFQAVYPQTKSQTKKFIAAPSKPDISPPNLDAGYAEPLMCW